MFLSAWVLYLVSPVSLHPAWILLPFALAFALAVRIMASTSKKHLWSSTPSVVVKEAVTEVEVKM